MATWTSDAVNNAETYIQPNNGQGNYFTIGTTSHNLIKGQTATSITGYFTNGGASQTISCYIQDASTNTLFGTAVIGTTATNVELTFTNVGFTLPTGNFIIHFRGQTSAINALWRTGTTCSGNCPLVYSNPYVTSPIFISWAATSNYGTMSVTYSGPAPSTGTRLPPPPIILGGL